MASFRLRLDEARRHDAEKDNLLSDLIDKVDQLQNSLEDSQEAERGFQQQADNANAEAQKLQNQHVADQFVVVLVDGDSLPFLDDLVAAGRDGGLEAGRRLRAEITEYLGSQSSNDRILIHIFANLRGLSNVSCQANIVADTSIVYNFAGGLGASHPLTSFVDSGNHKEAADHKMRAYMDIFYPTCCHLIFGAADSGYSGYLQTYARPSGSINPKITMLENGAFPHHLRPIMACFRSTSFHNIFRTEKIVVRPWNSALHGTKRSAPDGFEQQRQPDVPFPHDHQQTEQKENEESVQTLMDQVSSSEMSREPPSSGQGVYPPSSGQSVYINRFGQRIDSKIPWDKTFLQQLYKEKAKLCNNFYLNNYCKFGDACAWDHSWQLSPLELSTLRHKARSSVCRSIFCLDPNCPLGHMCPRVTTQQCQLKDCKFLQEMHNVDTNEVYRYDPVTTVKTLIHKVQFRNELGGV